MLKIGGKIVGRLDWGAGAFTYGNRINMGEILQRESNEYRALCIIYKEVYGWSARWLPFRKRYKVFSMITKQLQGWIDKEQTMLRYEPTEEQKRAGLDRLNKAVGEMATIRALAKEYGQDPDTILSWQYGKVFGILLCNLEEHKYNERYKKIIDERNRRYNKKGVR